MGSFLGIFALRALNPTFARGKSLVGMNGSLLNVLGRECDSNHTIPSTQKCPLGPKNTFSPFLVKNGSFLGAHHGSKKGYLVKTTAEKASVGPKLSKYNRGNDFGKIFFLPFFSPSSNFFQMFFPKKYELGGPVLRIRRRVTPG